VLWVHRIWQGEVEALGLNAILRMLIPKHVGGAVLSDYSSGESGDDDRGSHKRPIGKLLMVSNRSHTSNSGLAVVKHPIIHARFCGHKVTGRSGGSSRN
jgi:hypothetical protein